jgi:tripartite-type tricarboxylate transporter receptor subunit TctC
MGRQVASALVTAAIALVGIHAAEAADYPARPVEFIVGFGAGGGGDISQRLFNKYAEPLVGKRLPVTNKPGAGGVISWAELVRTTPDGYTLAYTAPPVNIIPALAKPKETGYKLDQFTNICVYAVIPDVILVPENSPYKTFADLVAYAKANPKRTKIANTGTLGGDFMTGLMIENAAGIETTPLPFSSGAQGTQATLAGVADAMIGSALHAVSQKGTMRTLGIAAPQRDAMVPDVPTFREMGLDVVSERYRGIVGPKGLPAEVVAYWADICKKVTDNPDFKAEMLKTGQPVAYKGPAEMTTATDKMAADMKLLVDKYKLAE